MTKKHEELAQELDDCLGDTHLGPAGRRVLIEDFITLVLSAVRDGRLDEELGVVGRGHIHAREFYGYSVSGLNLKEGDYPVIALRRPTIELDEPSFIAEIH